MNSKECAYCRRQFEFRRANAKYCSDNCKQMAYYARHSLAFVSSTAIASQPASTEPETGVKSFGFLPVTIKNTLPQNPTSPAIAELIFPDGTRLSFFRSIDLALIRDLLN